MPKDSTPYEEMRDDLERIRGTLARLREEGTAAIEELASRLDEAVERERGLPAAPRAADARPAPPPAP